MSAWSTAIPLLASLHRAGQLVPFIGSGMSRPLCSDWASFLAGLEPDSVQTASNAPQPDDLRRADQVTRRLRGLEPGARRLAIVRALHSQSQPHGAGPLPPPQSLALAQFHWPLVLTTNYDDVFWHAATLPSWKNDKFEVRGRSEADARAVVRSLDWPTNSILWAMQGFVGGICRPVGDVVESVEKRSRLLEEVVIGHRQYAEATFLNPVFRKAFSEVFRRRSFLFLGSGLADEYLVSLFSEVHLTLGQRAGGHFALLHTSEVTDASARFLSDRLGVRSLLFDDYSEVTEFLEGLLANSKHYMPAKFKVGERPNATVAVRSSSFAYTLSRVGGPELDLVLDNAPVVDDITRKDVLWVGSVGNKRTSSDGAGVELKPGSMLRQILSDLDLESSFEPVEGFESIYLQTDEPRLAVLAPPVSLPESGAGPQLLSSVRTGTREMLDYVRANRQITIVRMGLVSAGPKTPWHPSFSLAVMLSSIRDFYARCERPVRLELSLVDSRVWARVASGNLPVLEILSSDRDPVLVEVHGGSGAIQESVVVLLETGSCLSAIFEHLNLYQKDWGVELRPASGIDLPSSSYDDVQLFPYAYIALRPRLP